jgi:hypothetical protein
MRSSSDQTDRDHLFWYIKSPECNPFGSAGPVRPEGPAPNTFRPVR